MDSIVEKTYAIEQIDSDKTALEYIEKFIINGFKNARLLKTYGSLQRSQRLYKEAIKSYTGAIEAAKRDKELLDVANETNTNSTEPAQK